MLTPSLCILTNSRFNFEGVSFPPFLLAVVPLAWFYRRVMM